MVGKVGRDDILFQPTAVVSTFYTILCIEYRNLTLQLHHLQPEDLGLVLGNTVCWSGRSNQSDVSEAQPTQVKLSTYRTEQRAHHNYLDHTPGTCHYLMIRAWLRWAVNLAGSWWVEYQPPPRQIRLIFYIVRTLMSIVQSPMPVQRPASSGQMDRAKFLYILGYWASADFPCRYENSKV